MTCRPARPRVASQIPVRSRPPHISLPRRRDGRYDLQGEDLVGSVEAQDLFLQRQISYQAACRFLPAKSAVAAGREQMPRLVIRRDKYQLLQAAVQPLEPNKVGHCEWDHDLE